MGARSGCGRYPRRPWGAGNTVFVVDSTGHAYDLARKTDKTRWVAMLPEDRLWRGPILRGGKL
jgi:hypothetical protein